MAGNGVTGIYLDADSKAKLDEMAEATGGSRSLVVRNLIQQAGSSASKNQLRKAVAKLADLVEAT